MGESMGHNKRRHVDKQACHSFETKTTAAVRHSLEDGIDDRVGAIDGILLGSSDGLKDGTCDGSRDGKPVSCFVGTNDGVSDG